MSDIDHWKGFADFCRLDKLAGGPDSHMKTIVHMAKNVEDPLWLIGIYASVYNVPMAEIVYKEFPDHRSLSSLHDWLNENWKHVVLRRERKRPVGSPTKLSDCFATYAHWLEKEYPKVKETNSYETLWNSINSVQYIGRYSKMKVLEALRQFGAVKPILCDLRASGGWSPREGLALLCPEHKDLLEYGGNARSEVREIEKIGIETYRSLTERGVVIDNYEWQVFLCDYKQSAVTMRQYPGRSLDSELTYHSKIEEYFPHIGNDMFDARLELFPKWALAEHSGWSGVREDLGTFFVRTGTMWSDAIFEYPSLKRRENALV